MIDRIVFSMIVLLLQVATFRAQTSFTDCRAEPVSLCVQDPGISLPDSNQLFIGEDTPGATSCGVHVTQTRTITSNCIGSIDYYVALIVNDSLQEILQPLKTVYVDFSNQATIQYDTRNAVSASVRRNGLYYNEGCSDVHTIRWVVIDKCGNEVVCEERILLYDCQLPDFVQQTGIVLYLPIGCFGISGNASQLIADVKDDCLSRASVLYSFELEKYKPDTFIYCEEITAFGVELPFEVFIADHGTDQNCNGEIEWNERIKFKEVVPVVLSEIGGSCHCGLWEPDYFSGKVNTMDGRPIEKVAVNLTAPGKVFPTYVTAGDGKYYFSNVIFPDNYTIRASRNDNHRNGVSTLDIIKIHQHLLGTDPLDNPYQIIAADANNSTNASFIDIVELRKLVLGIYTELPGTPWSSNSWKFISADHVFTDSMDPWPIDEDIEITNSSDSVSFIGIKIGDVNNSVIAVDSESPFEVARPTMIFSTDQKRYIRGEAFDIPVRLSHDGELLGMQFTVSSPDLQLSDVSMEALGGAMQGAYAPIEDKITISWHSPSPLAFNGIETLFTIRARALLDGNLGASLSINSAITEAEAYDEHENIFKPVLDVRGGERQRLLLPPTPSPWNQQTTIAFHLDAATDVILSITDVNRNLLWQQSVTGHAGRNEITVNADEVQGAGLLFCTMQAGGEVQYQKMMLVR
jgi:hypothetical protein